MLTVNQNILVDFASKEAVHVTDFKYKQGEIDKSGINIDIASASITENTVLKINWLYAADYDYVYVQNDGDYISSTKMKIYPPQNTLLPGLVAFEILLVEMSGETPLSQLKGPSVYIPVAEALIDDEEASMEDENIAAIISLINENDRLIGVVEQLDADVRAAEAVRDQNETNRNNTLDTKVSTVNSTVTAANTAKTNADNAATSANTKAALANDKATLANTARDAANAAKTAADTAKSAADTATTNANNAATAANNAATAANTAATSANTAATNANNAATAANTAADRATAAITSSSAAVTEISQARVDMSGTTHASIGARMNSDFNTLASAVPKEIAVFGTETITTNDTLSGDVSSAVLSGQTLVNVVGNQFKLSNYHYHERITFHGQYVEFTKSSGLNSYAPLKNSTTLLKPSTVYTVFIDVAEITTPCSFGHVRNAFTSRIDINQTGKFLSKMTTKSELRFDNIDDSVCMTFHPSIGSADDGHVIYRTIILEGDHTDKPLEFFEGLKSAEVSEVTSHGVNLVDCYTQTLDGSTILGSNSFIPRTISNACYYRELDVTKTYRLSFKATRTGGTNTALAWALDENLRNYNGSGYFAIRVLDASYPVGSTESRSYTLSNRKGVCIQSNGAITFAEVTIVEVTGSEPSTYVPHQSSTTTLPSPVVLRSLPNGVADTYDFDTQTLVRRCGEVVFDGTESWALANGGTDTHIQVSLNIANKVISATDISEPLICDKFNFSKIWLLSQEAIQNMATTNKILISIAKSRLTTPDVAGFKAWLAQNPTTVVYQLATPTTEVVDNSGLIRSYDNQTTLTADSVVPADLKSNIPINLKAWLESQNVTMAMLANDASIQAAMMEQIEEEQKVQSAEISSAQLALIDLYEMGL